VFKKIIGSLIGKTESQGKHGNQPVPAKQEPKKAGPNIPKMLNLDTIDYYPLPPSPSKWESNPQEVVFPGSELFVIAQSRDEQINIAEVRKLSMAERPDPAYKIIMPGSLGFIEIDKNGKAKNLPGCSSALALRDKRGNFVKEVGLDHSIYRIGLDHYAKHFALMDKEAVLHIYNEQLEKIFSFDLAIDPRVIQIRESELDFYGDVRTSIRCVDVTSDGSSHLFTIADSAFLVNKFGETIWARSMPLGEGWVREFVKGDRVGTSGEVFEALAFMQLTLPVTREQIRKRYRDLSLEFHPDLNRGLRNRGEMMKTLNLHHDVLTGMDSNELARDTNKERITYRRTKPDSAQKIRFSQNNISYEVAIEISSGGPALDWIYAAAISNRTGGTYLGTYSGKVVKLDAYGDPEYALDVANVPREIIEVDQFLYILTDTRLYIVGEGQALVNIVDVHGQGKLAVSPAGFGLYSNKSLSWYNPTGEYKFSLGTKHPLRTFYISSKHLVVETRQHRAFIAFGQDVGLPTQEEAPKPEKQVINEGTGKLQAEKERQVEIDAQVPATLENLSSLKRAGRYEEAIAVLMQEVKDQEAEDKVRKWGVAPWAYGELAKIYRKQKDYKNEVKILKRYMLQKKGTGVMPKKLAERLEKAQVLFEKSERGK
jgi:hypothetical protein